MIPTPTDAFNRPTALGNCDGLAVPIAVDADGRLRMTGAASGGTRYVLAQTLPLGLNTGRVLEPFDISFDSFAVASLRGSFWMYIGGAGDSHRLTINQCLSVTVSAEQVFFSNDPQDGFAELWFFKQKEA